MRVRVILKEATIPEVAPGNFHFCDVIGIMLWISRHQEDHNTSSFLFQTNDGKPHSQINDNVILKLRNTQNAYKFLEQKSENYK
jgi:hypothetical protein